MAPPDSHRGENVKLLHCHWPTAHFCYLPPTWRQAIHIHQHNWIIRSVTIRRRKRHLSSQRINRNKPTGPSSVVTCTIIVQPRFLITLLAIVAIAFLPKGAKRSLPPSASAQDRRPENTPLVLSKNYLWHRP